MILRRKSIGVLTETLRKNVRSSKANFLGSRWQKEKLSDAETVKEVTDRITGKEFAVTKVEKKERKRNPANPFTTSSLQQEAARKLNFRTRKTMMVAQQLYEGISLGKQGTIGLITYMRTDSTRIADTAKAEVATFIEETYGKNSPVIRNVKQRTLKEHKMPMKQCVQPVHYVHQMS